jgi:hypothetical protein
MTINKAPYFNPTVDAVDCPACNKFTMYFITSLLSYTKVHAVVALRECPA